MSLSEKDRTEERAKYQWDSVGRDLALSTPLTVRDAVRFSRLSMQSTGIHPFDLVEWVYFFYRRGADHEALRDVIVQAYNQGRADAGAE